ncbi:MAG: DUF58 domain-containing protein [Lachnospiraceae bacterium]|nr:DUF58 domain-containing protein [Lachnospiraceae bacterium]
MKNKVVYVLFLGILLIAYLMSDSAYASLALGTAVVLLLFLAVQTWYLKRHISGRINLSENIITRGDSIRIPVLVKNTGKLPVTQICARIKYMDADSGKWKNFHVYGMVERKGEICMEGYLKTFHCSVVTLYLERLTVSDYFGIFSAVCDFESVQKEMYVLPWTNISMADALAEAGDFAGKYGEDVYETYDIREFRNGDDVRQIHWKLTAKMDILLVREYLKTSESGVMIRLDFDKEKEKAYSKEEIDSFLDKASSLSWEILRWGVSHYILWNRENESITLFIEEEENFIEYQMILINMVVCNRKVDTTYFKEKVINEEKIHTIRMDLEGKVYWEDGTEIK